MERRWLRFALRGAGRRWHSYVVAVVGRQWSGAVASMGFTFIQFSSVQFDGPHFQPTSIFTASVRFNTVQFSSVPFSSLYFVVSLVQFSSVQFSSVQAPRTTIWSRPMSLECPCLGVWTRRGRARGDESSSVWFSVWATGSRPGPADFAEWALFRLRRRILPIHNFYCSQRACTLEKGAGSRRRETAFPA
jgi:hypothetical protein